MWVQWGQRWRFVKSDKNFSVFGELSADNFYSDKDKIVYKNVTWTLYVMARDTRLNKQTKWKNGAITKYLSNREWQKNEICKHENVPFIRVSKYFVFRWALEKKGRVTEEQEGKQLRSSNWKFE